MGTDVSHSAMTAGVTRSISEYVDTLEKVELLALLIESSEKWWDAGSAAEMLGTTTGAARQILERCAAQNLLEIRVTDDVRHRLRPGNSHLEAAVRECANTSHQSARCLATGHRRSRHPPRLCGRFQDSTR